MAAKSKQILKAISGLSMLFFISAQTVSAQENSFSDVSEGNSHFVAINYLKNNNIVAGYDDGTFKPNQDINRAEALKMVMDAINGPSTTNPETMNFKDVTETDWYYEWVQKAWNNYLANGYPDGFFHPENNINVAESLKIVLSQEGNPIPTTVDISPYNDVPVDSWYAAYATVSKERTLFLESRKGGNLGPSETMDRGWFAELIYRTIKSSTGSRFARATWYADYSASTQTASGESLSNEQFTTAHKTLPFGTWLEVTNLANGKTVKVRVNDRGPFSTGIDLDLSKSAFSALASTGEGIITTEYKVLDESTQATTTPQTTTPDTSSSTTTDTTDQLPPPIDEHSF